MRAALGAGRPRLIRQMLTESALLWTLGGLAGVAVGSVLLEWLMSIAPGGLPRADAVRIDARVLLFAAGVTAVTGALFGLLPALSVTAVRARSLSAGASRGAVGASSRRARQALVVVDLAVALVLLAGAGLMFRTVSSLLRLDPGFESERVLTAQFSLIGEAYREDSAVYAFIERVVERAGALPGVEAAAIAGQIPMGGNGDRFGTYIEGLEPANRAEAPSLERVLGDPRVLPRHGDPGCAAAGCWTNATPRRPNRSCSCRRRPPAPSSMDGIRSACARGSAARPTRPGAGSSASSATSVTRS